ncbi:MAG TPA: hypothetical protein VMW52_12535 [Phycisphaerae bacterium]|nr:hypothetical protein [Phycisphaerae bacterium]
MASTLVDYVAMVPNLKHQGVVEIFVGESALIRAMNFIDLAERMHYDYNREASLGGVAFRAVGEEYSGSALGVGVVNPATEGTVIMGGMVPLDRQFAGNQSYKASKIAMKVKAASRFFTRMFFDGNTTTDPKQFDGLNKRLTGPNVVYAGANGDYIDLEVLSERIDRVPGEASQKRLLMSAAMRRTLGANIRAHGATGMTMAEWEGELKPKAYDDVPILIVGEDEDGNEILAFDETRGSSHVTGSIYCVRFGGSVDEEMLQGLARKAAELGLFEVEDQGRVGTQDKTLVEGRVGLCLFHPRCAVRYAGIKEGVSP